MFLTVNSGKIVYPHWMLGIVQWGILYAIFFVNIMHLDFSRKEKLSLISYIILPTSLYAVSNVLMCLDRDPIPESIIDLCVVLSLYLIFFNMYYKWGKN